MAKITSRGLLLLASTLAFSACTPRDLEDGQPVLGAEQADQHRIRTHLRTVEAELRAVDTSALDSTQKDKRAAGLDRLHDYWIAGVFPQNPEPSPPTPYFFDRDGRSCAVAALVVDSGHAELAHAVETRENNAYVRDMTTPGLPEWADAHGFSATELGRIQPSYCNCDSNEEPVCGADGRSYLNSCVAENCAGVEVAHEGVCDADEADPDGWPEGPITPEDAEDVEDIEDVDEALSRGCSVARSPGEAPWLAALPLLALLGWRRRRA